MWAWGGGSIGLRGRLPEQVNEERREATVMEEKVEEAKEAAVTEEEKMEDATEAGAAEKKSEGEADKAGAEGVQGTAKAKKPRSRKPRSEGPHHPPYFEMIKEAIMAAGDGKAEASTYAIAKRVGERHGDALPGNYRKVLAVQLRNFAAKGRLVRVKASFRLAPAEEKKALASSARKRRGTKKAASKKKGAPAPAPAPAPARAKRTKKAAPPAKPKPKQPKSIRAGLARKANKASA